VLRSAGRALRDPIHLVHRSAQGGWGPGVASTRPPARSHPGAPGLGDRLLGRLSTSERSAAWLIPLLRAYIRYAPFAAGKAWLWSRVIHPYFAWTHHRFACKTQSAGRIAGDTRDILQQYYFGVWEPNLTHWIVGRLRRGDTFVDVGANIGYYSLLASKLVGPGGSVVALEASPTIFHQLQDNLRLNNSLSLWERSGEGDDFLSLRERSREGANFLSLPERSREGRPGSVSIGNIRAVNVAVSDRAGAALLYRGPAPTRRCCSMTAFVQFAICNLQFAICIMVIFLNGCAPPTVAALPVTPTAPRPPAKKVARPVEAIDRVLIISIDGLRPDLALRAYMPRVRALCASGSYTFWAETAAEAYTLPCHVSMLTGVSSDKHGVTWNDYIEEAWPNSPTLFELAHEAGYTTALVTGKMKFITLLKPMEGSQGSGFRVQEESLAPPKRPGEGSGDAERVQGSPARIGFRLQDDANAGSPPPSDEAIQNPKSKIQNPEPLTPNPQPLLFQRPTFRDSNTVDHYFLPSTEPISDHDVATEAVRVMRDHRPEVFFVHFPGVDTVGHERGWGTPEQITAIEQADAAVGRVLDALAELDLTNATLIILTADHGGAGLDHRAGDPRCHFIPWIISGPGIRQDFDLTLTERPIHIEDTFATACAFLSVACETACDGTPLVEALKKREPVSLPTEN
jgi:hypothetical protein